MRNVCHHLGLIGSVMFFGVTLVRTNLFVEVPFHLSTLQVRT